MKKVLLAFLGVGLLIFTVIFRNNLIKDEKEAIAMDKQDEKFGIIDGPLPCKWEAEEPERIQTENKSQSVVIRVTNQYGAEECQSVIYLRAPGFDVSPVKEEQTITLRPKTDGSLSWIISPRKVGSYEIAVSDALNTKIFGVKVTNMFGLSAVQAKSASIIGTVFGPMLTIPWWWEKWFQKRKKPDQNNSAPPDSK